MRALPPHAGPAPGFARMPAAGSLRGALRTATRAMGDVPAYRRFLEERGFAPDDAILNEACWPRLPCTDKRAYCLRYPYADLLSIGRKDGIWFLARSAGTGGLPFFWPHLKPSPSRSFLDGPERAAKAVLRLFSGKRTTEHRPFYEPIFSELFAVDRHRTLAIVGHALGSWGGSVNAYAALLTLAARLPTLTVFCIGNRFDEIVETAVSLESLYDRILILVSPSSAESLLEAAQAGGAPFPFGKCRFAVTGEPFSEDFRERLERLCGAEFPDLAVASYAYSAGDIGMIGRETLSSVALRKLLHKSARVREILGIESPVPNLYALRADDLYVEQVGEELVFTRDGALPRVRYNLHDRGELLDGRLISGRLRGLELPRELRVFRDALCGAPAEDFIVYRGRTDGVKFAGSLIAFDDFAAALRHPALAEWTTGRFQVEERRQPRHHLALAVESRAGRSVGPELAGTFYRVLVDEMRRMSSRFERGYKESFRHWERAEGPKVFEISFRPFPELTEAQSRYPKLRP